MKPNVMLVAMPWHRFDLLSIQIGGLKAFLQRHGIQVSTRHYYKDIVAYLGLPLYEAIVHSNVCEALFAPLLFPEHQTALAQTAKEGVQRVVAEQNGRAPLEIPFDLETCLAQLRAFLDDILRDAPWQDYSLVGFTCTHVQSTASLVLAKLLKERYPALRVAFGGFLLRGEIATSLLELFPFVDYVVTGEGEVPLLKLVKAQEGKISFADVPNLVFRAGGGHTQTSGLSEAVLELDDLPIPDYSDYRRHTLGASLPLHPTIQLEASRGCHWGRCTFCVETMPSRRNYRRKSAAKIVAEVEALTDQVASLDLLFADADLSDKPDVADAIAGMGLDLRITGEFTGLLTRESLERFAKAGARNIQVGIESFSPRLLRIYNKGVPLIRYVEILKWCSELRVNVYYNMIVGAPYETENDVAAALHTMDVLRHYQPPQPSRFTVSYLSDTYLNPGRYGIEQILPYDRMRECYPKEVCRKLTPLVSFGEHTGYSFRPQPLADGSQLVARIEKWRKDSEPERPSMTCRKGKGFLDIVISEGRSLYHHRVVNEIEQEIYLSCMHSALRLADIRTRVPGADKDTIEFILRRFVLAGLMFSDGGQYLSLASPMQ